MTALPISPDGVLIIGIAVGLVLGLMAGLRITVVRKP